MSLNIHPTAEISSLAKIGSGTRIWHHAQIRENVVIGHNCIIGKGVYVDEGVLIGDNVKIQNYVSIYQGVTIEDGVFVGPHVCFTNDKWPRAVNNDGSLKDLSDWHTENTTIRTGASLGANSTIVCGSTIGKWVMVGAGSVVTRNLPDYALAVGNPASLRGFVCPCGNNLVQIPPVSDPVLTECRHCGAQTSIDLREWEKIE